MIFVLYESGVERGVPVRYRGPEPSTNASKRSVDVAARGCRWKAKLTEWTEGQPEAGP
jgi:hypothetical protein